MSQSRKFEEEDKESIIANNDSLDEDQIPVQLCVRHISTIQIRNLSPSPTRDSVAAALTHQFDSEPPSSWQVTDDADFLIRLRKRRTSIASTHTLGSVPPEHDYEKELKQGSVSPRIRPRASSKASHGARTSSPAERRHAQGCSPSPSARHGQRTSSEITALPEDASMDANYPSTSAKSSSWLSGSTTSQKNLENAIWSRLIETFITLNISEREFRLTPSLVNASETISKMRTIQAQIKAKTQHTSQSSSTSTKALARTKFRPSHNSVLSGDTSSSCTSLNTLNFPHSPPLTPPPTNIPGISSVPAFISSVHRPSTNPKFCVEPAHENFAKWSDLSSGKALIRLWGRTTSEWKSSKDGSNAKGKEKERMWANKSMDNVLGEWELLDEWEIDLAELAPLPDDMYTNPWKLPPNTLIITLSTSTRAFYVPSTLTGVSPISSRPPSPEYSSDSELSRRDNSNFLTLSPRRGRLRKSRRELKSPNFNELLKLVSLQASLADAQNLLDEVVENCNNLIEKDKYTVLQREASECEYHLQCLQEQRDALDDYMKAARERLQTRREEIRQRRIRLAGARALHEDDLLTEFDSGVRLAEERKSIHALRRQIEPIQTSLLSTLSFIFPIDLLSPPDLLYTILDVPLPIPMNGTDPAPPLTLPHVNSVNEDSVATALGYAALVVHLMAAYLCRLLVYPITYVGSRSLIKDPISAMMGPRMFPLYSKGVDTYRFEYAVFLLNKDIEMLMMDRNLRALDLRHTLPNLKNLLLTLTSGEVVVKPRSRPLPSPSVDSITAALQTPETRPESGDVRTSEVPVLLLDDSSTTPKVEGSSLPLVHEGLTKTVNGTSNEEVGIENVATHGVSSNDTDGLSSNVSEAGTISAASNSDTTVRPRLPRLPIQSYLGLAPLASMWRGRASNGSNSDKLKGEARSEHTHTSQPPTSDLSLSDGQSVASTSTTPELGGGVQECEVNCNEEEEDDEDDRCTVRGTSVPTTPIAEIRSSEGSFGTGVLDNLKAHIRGSAVSNNVPSNGKRVTTPSETTSKGNEGTDPNLERLRAVVV